LDCDDAWKLNEAHVIDLAIEKIFTQQMFAQTRGMHLCSKNLLNLRHAPLPSSQAISSTKSDVLSLRVLVASICSLRVKAHRIKMLMFREVEKFETTHENEPGPSRAYNI
jgi:hypothetical protein